MTQRHDIIAIVSFFLNLQGFSLVLVVGTSMLYTKYCTSLYLLSANKKASPADPRLGFLHIRSSSIHRNKPGPAPPFLFLHCAAPIALALND